MTTLQDTTLQDTMQKEVLTKFKEFILERIDDNKIFHDHYNAYYYTTNIPKMQSMEELKSLLDAVAPIKQLKKEYKQLKEAKEMIVSKLRRCDPDMKIEFEKLKNSVIIFSGDIDYTYRYFTKNSNHIYGRRHNYNIHIKFQRALVGQSHDTFAGRLIEVKDKELK